MWELCSKFKLKESNKQYLAGSLAKVSGWQRFNTAGSSSPTSCNGIFCFCFYFRPRCFHLLQRHLLFLVLLWCFHLLQRHLLISVDKSYEKWPSLSWVVVGRRVGRGRGGGAVEGGRRAASGIWNISIWLLKSGALVAEIICATWKCERGLGEDCSQSQSEL